VEVFDALFQQRHRVGFVNSIPLQISGIARRDRVFEPYAPRRNVITGSSTAATSSALSGFGPPRTEITSKARLVAGARLRISQAASARRR
jgi:hypothetical protein